MSNTGETTEFISDTGSLTLHHRDEADWRRMSEILRENPNGPETMSASERQDARDIIQRSHVALTMRQGT